MESQLEEEKTNDNQSPSPHLKIENLRKTFNDGKIVAIEDFNLDIGNEDFVVFVGPSGCGKTTTLRCIAGLEQPDSGEIYIDGQSITHTPPKDRNLAFVFQDIALFPHMNVKKNIQFGLDMKSNISTDEKNQRIEHTARILDISDYLMRKPSALSGGQQQRVAIGRAMVMNPEAFLLDEPFSALDANLRNQMQTEIQRIHNEINKSMVFVTHDQSEAMTLGDKIVVMNNGEIVQVGTPYEIYNEPVSLFVASFIGSPPTNIFEGHIQGNKKSMNVNIGICEFGLNKKQSESINNYAGQAVKVGIRPHKLNIKEGNAHFNGKINIIEPQGEYNVIHFTVNDSEVQGVFEQDMYLNSGDHIPISINVGDVWLFNTEGERIL